MAALKQQCEVDTLSASIHMRIGPIRKQIQSFTDFGSVKKILPKNECCQNREQTKTGVPKIGKKLYPRVSFQYGRLTRQLQSGRSVLVGQCACTAVMNRQRCDHGDNSCACKDPDKSNLCRKREEMTTSPGSVSHHQSVRFTRRVLYER